MYKDIKTKMVKRIRRKKHQRGRFLNRYDFAYAGRDTVNQAVKGLVALAPKIITQATGQVDQIAQGGQQVEKIAPKIKSAIEEVYKTPFRLLGKIW